VIWGGAEAALRGTQGLLWIRGMGGMAERLQVGIHHTWSHYMTVALLVYLPTIALI
jgi:hypothetical protein